MRNIQKMKLELIAQGHKIKDLNQPEIVALYNEVIDGQHAPTRPLSPLQMAIDKNANAPTQFDAPPPKPKKPAPVAPTGALEAAIAAIVDERLKGFNPESQLDEASVAAMIENLTHRTITVEVKTPLSIETIEGAHAALPELVRWLGVDEHVYMHGPAGSGKTTLASQAAAALNRPFYKTGAVLSKYELVGFVDGAGNYHETAFFRAWIDGGVFLFDEMDSSAPEAIVAINDALSNGSYTFPHKSKPIPKHPDFIAIGAGNTTGTGATRQYVGRNPLDAASRDRFKTMEIDYDVALEKRIGLTTFKQYGGADSLTSECTRYIEKLIKARKIANERGFHVVVSPRGTARVAKAVALGLSSDDVMDEILGGFSTDQRKQIEGAL